MIEYFYMEKQWKYKAHEGIKNEVSNFYIRFY